MKFISYKEWKQLNESMGQTTPLSIRKPTTIGELQSRWTEMGMVPMRSKKMSMGGMGDMVDMGGEETPMPLKKKKKGPPVPPPELDDDEEDADLDDIGDIGDDEENIEDDEDDLDADADLGDESDEEGDEEDLDTDIDDLGDDEDDLEDDEDEGLPLPPPIPKKAKGKPPIPGAAMMTKGMSRMIKGMKESTGCGAECKCKKCKKKLTKEDAEFIDSVKNQCGSAFFDINSDGSFKEDAVFSPSNPNADLESEQEPKPGDVGFAPQQKVGSELGSMAEWTKKYHRKINEAIQAKEKPAKKNGKTKAKARKK